MFSFPLLARSPLGVLALLGAAALFTLGSGTASVAALPSATILVAFKEGAPGAVRSAAVGRLGLQAERAVVSPRFTRVAVPVHPENARAELKAAAAALRRDPAVRIAEPNLPVYKDAVPNDPRFADQWALNNTGQTGGTADADVDAPEAWDVTTGSSAVTVAVIDTGVEYTHPDLAANILRDNGGNLVGYDFGEEDADPMDHDGHGTHVAGIVGAVGNNAVGVSGICPTVRIMPVKFFTDAGGGDVGNAIRAIDFAVEHGARIINASWGTYDRSDLLLEAIERARDAGVLFVAAAGNGGNDSAGDNNDELAHYPSSFTQETDNMLAVAATDSRDRLASFSNYGVHSVDLAAPGVGILSTFTPGIYGQLSGTSMAAPCVAGAAALLLARYPALSVSQLKIRLLANTDHPGALAGTVASSGRLNALAALREDDVAPGQPGGLTASHRTLTALRLDWIASGDDGEVGSAYAYELRYSPNPITAQNFADALAGGYLPAPAASGTPQSCVLDGLAPQTEYYVALRALDFVGNASPLEIAGPFATAGGSDPCYLQDDAEATPLFTGTGFWGVTTEQAVSGTHSYTDSPGTSTLDDANTALTQNRPVRLAGSVPYVSFQAKLDLEEGFDFLYVEASTNGLVWTTLGQFTGVSGWAAREVSLLPFHGKNVRVRFRLATDRSVDRDGVWVDDIRICSRATATLLLEDTVEGTHRFVGQKPWGVTEKARFSPAHAYTDSPNGNYGRHVNVSLTQKTAISLEGQLSTLSFWARTDLEEGYDFLRVELSADGGVSWVRLRSLTGLQDPRFYQVSLAEYTGKRVKVRFRLVSDTEVQQNGVWIDDIRISGEAFTPYPSAGEGGKLQTPAKVNFGTVGVRSAGRVRVVQLRNTGTAGPLRVSLGDPGAAFSVVEGGGVSVIPAGGSLSVRVRFKPEKRGSVTGVLRVASTDAETPAAGVALTGTGS